MAKSGNKKVANGLMALSSAAVLAVYSAGYAKTDAAAQRIAAQSQRHRSPASDSEPIAPPPSAPSVPEPSQIAHSQTEHSRTEPQQIATLNPLHSASPLPDAAPAPASSASPLSGQAPAVKAPAPQQANTPAPAPAADSKTSTTSSVAPGTPAPPAPAPTPQAAPAQPEKPKIDYFGVLTADLYDKHDTPASAKWKNGTYYGWGSCNHGDLQAAVVIQDGQIDSAFIAQCLTRYSCDVIDKLPNMVAKRQSLKLDSVSGATESAQAFMDAIDDALTKAKNPNYKVQAPISQK